MLIIILLCFQYKVNYVFHRKKLGNYVLEKYNWKLVFEKYIRCIDDAFKVVYSFTLLQEQVLFTGNSF